MTITQIMYITHRCLKYDSIKKPKTVVSEEEDMDDPRMELPPPEELGEWLRATRSEHGVTQTELAERLDVSPSQISRIESRQGGARYETLYRLQQELLTVIDATSTIQVKDVLTRKHDVRSSAYELVAVAPDDSVETAVEQMEELNISQLPVIEASGQSAGRLTERYLLGLTTLPTEARPHILTPFPVIPAATPATLALHLLDTTQNHSPQTGHTVIVDLAGTADVDSVNPSDSPRVALLQT